MHGLSRLYVRLYVFCCSFRGRSTSSVAELPIFHPLPSEKNCRQDANNRNSTRQREIYHTWYISRIHEMVTGDPPDVGCYPWRSYRSYNRSCSRVSGRTCAFTFYLCVPLLVAPGEFFRTASPATELAARSYRSSAEIAIR